MLIFSHCFVFSDVHAWELTTQRWFAFRECEADEGMVRLVPDIKGADPGAAGLLIECRGQTPECLNVRMFPLKRPP